MFDGSNDGREVGSNDVRDRGFSGDGGDGCEIGDATKGLEEGVKVEGFCENLGLE